MYNPAHFVEIRPEILHAAIRAHPLAALIALTPAGLTANHLPMLLSADGQTLTGHVARANPLWRDYDTATEVLALFTGQQAYISPALYPTKQENPRVVPTWNYIAVHAHGPLRTFDDPDRLLALVTALTTEHESPRPNPWHVTDAPADFIAGQLHAIVGIEIPITRLEGKWKMSQNRDPRDRESVLAHLRESGLFSEPL